MTMLVPKENGNTEGLTASPEVFRPWKYTNMLNFDIWAGLGVEGKAFVLYPSASRK